MATMPSVSPKIHRVLMCRPTHFQVNYHINPWMQIGTANSSSAIHQWQSLVSTYEQLGVQVDIIEQDPNLPDMVFAADQAILRQPHSKNLLLGRFRYPERQPEISHYQAWFDAHQLQYEALPSEIIFEGEGEAAWLGQILLLGIGFRSDEHTATYLTHQLQLPVVTLQLVDDRFYHLDTCLCIVNQQTACYYPPAFSPDSQRLLRQHIPDLIEIPEAEAEHFVANSVATDNNVIMPPECPFIASQLQQRGYQIHEVATTEFLKAGGGIHCLTLILESEA